MLQAGIPVREPIYIVVGNHRSVSGIQEIVNTISGVLSKEFPIELSSELKNDRINIVIDEFSLWSDQIALQRTKELHPNTKLVLVATEFITPVSLFGVELTKTFNFFGRPREWEALLVDVTRPLVGKLPSYMRQRFMGFVRALNYLDLIVVVHRGIIPELKKLTDRCPNLIRPPLLVLPEIGELTVQQENRLRTLPIGFTMTGTQTGYRQRVTNKLINAFRRVGWTSPIYKHVPFESPPATISSLLNAQAHYNNLHPDYLFSLNPPQSARWSYSSPMRILRAIYLGQIPVVTKKFDDHPLEQVALLWDGSQENSLEVAAFTIRDRDGWLAEYKRSIVEYDRVAQQANRQFVEAVSELARVRSREGGPPAIKSGAVPT